MKPWYLLVGVAGVAFVAAIISRAVEDAVGKARDELFEVGPNCEWIRFRGQLGGDISAEEANARLELARKYYLEPKIAEARAAGLQQPEQITAFVLSDLFPMCQWPPTELFSSHQVVWLAMRGWISSAIGGS